MKKLIDRYSFEVFVASHRYAKMKKLYIYNLTNPKFTKLLKQRLKEKLSSLLKKKIVAKKIFRNLIQYYFLNFSKFRNIYDPITDFDCIKEKLENINKFVKDNTEKLNVNENVILNIYELLGRLKKQIFIIANEENAKVTEFQKINTSNKKDILKKYIDF